jgi:hypothetical protein
MFIVANRNYNGVHSLHLGKEEHRLFLEEKTEHGVEQGGKEHVSCCKWER